MKIIFFFSSRRRHTRYWRDWSSDVCSSDLCDPVLSRLRVAKAGKATTRTFRGLPQAESKITLTNLRPGVRSRSEERRVGKEGRFRWSRYHYKKTNVQQC